MTAVANPPNVHSVPRSWSTQNLDTMTPELFMPRGGKPQRYPVSNPSTGSLDSSSMSNGSWVSSLGGKKKGATRAASVAGVMMNGNGVGGWPKSDGNHVRTNGSMSSQSGSVNGIHQPGPILPSQHLNGGVQLQNGHAQTSYLMLISLNGTFDRKQIPLPYYPETLRIGRQTNAKTIPTPMNGYFDSKVLSRQHAEVWAEKGTNKVWIRDIKSSNGTFVNGQRLSPENQDSEAHELHTEDVLELGIDIVGEDNKTIVHHKVAARVEHAGIHVGNFDLNFGDIDPLVNGSMPPVHGPNQGMRARTSSQSSRGTVQMGSTNTGPQHRQQPIMMAPVSMEMVVRRLNQELHAARQQAQDIQRATELFDSILASSKAQEAEKTAPAAAQTNGNAKAKSQENPPTIEISDGSADERSSAHATKPERASTNVAPPEKMLSLVGELARARQEMETNSARIHDLEEALKREKHAREVAEDRAAQLENTSRLARANPNAEDPVATAAKAAVELQQRMEAILEELASVKNDMHSYKLRAEAAEMRAAAAEKERDADKTTLLDTIRQIRAEEISRLARATEASSQTTADDSNADADATETRDFGVQVTTPGDGRRASAPPGIIRADSSSIHTVQGLSEEQTLLLRKQSAAPYASLLGVVVLGVGLMAVINNWQRGDR